MTGCHGLIHQHRIHLKYEDSRWMLLYTSEPTKYEKAMAMEGWVLQ